jgi:hypothetical protein
MRKSSTTSPGSIPSSGAGLPPVLPHPHRVEKSRTAVEFADDIVTAIEESEDNQGGNVRIIVPPVIFGW